MTFGEPQWFWGLLVLPVLVLCYIYAGRRRAERLRDFAAARLLPQLSGNVNRFRRRIKFALQLLALALAVIALARPQVGYVFEDVKRKGIDLLIAVDTSRSMLSNDVQPNRLEKVKLAVQDLINQLQGDRVGLIAFAGRAFVQAPLTIDYDAVVEAINDLDTKTIPDGGTNISEAITLADRTYGKSATGNRAMVIFTDGEELSGDAVKTAKAAADAGARIFTVGVGTAGGSLIPIPGDDGGTAFVKDSKGQVVKSKLDEKRLKEVAEATGGFYLHLENGPRTMQQLFNEGIAKIKAGEIDVRLSRRPIERYEWPLGAAALVLAISMLIGERKRSRASVAAVYDRRAVTEPANIGGHRPPLQAAVLVLFLLSAFSAHASAPGLDAYQDGKFDDAYQQFQETLKAHPATGAADKLQFDSGAAAYKMKDYGKALESFSQALLSPDTGLQGKSHYNLGNTLYERGETQKGDDKKLGDWTNALQHYEQTLKMDPQNKEAKDNYDYVKKKIEELKKKQEQQKPPPQKKDQKNDKQDKQDQKQQQDQQNSEQNQQQQQNEQQQQQNQQQQSSQQQNEKNEQQKEQESQSQSGKGQNQKPEDKQDKSEAKNEPQKSKADATPTPSPGENQQSGQPSPSPGEGKEQPKPNDKSSSEKNPQESPSPGENENASPSPSPGEGEGGSGEGASPSPAPQQSPPKKFAGDIKGASGDKSDKPKEQAEAEIEPEKEGEMNQRQAEALLQSMKDEEARVQLDERRPAHRVYNDW